MPCPRPILKRFGVSSDDSDSPNSREGGLSRMSISHNKVHFPNHPDALVRTHFADSADDYDRSPIRIKPNICALPERGCPGRTYSGDDAMDVDDNRTGLRRSTRSRKGDHRHPCTRVVGFLGSSDMLDSPTLVQDASDISEDSDGSYSAPFLSDNFNPSLMPPSGRYSSSASSFSPASASHSPRLSPKANSEQLAFLPYPHPSPHTSDRSSLSSYSSGSPARDARPVRRPPSSPTLTRQRQRSRSKVRGSPVRHGIENKHGYGSYGGQGDEGCLGGF